MTNKEIEFQLTLRDQLTAKWRAATDKISDGAKNMVRQFERHWASITAGAFAAWGAIHQAMDFADAYMKHAQSLAAFSGMVRAVGLDATTEFEKIRTASGGLIDDQALVESANRAMSLGIPIEKLAGFLEIARAKARDMGTTTQSAFSDLVVALGRQSAPILDNLGIVVKIEVANEAYAKSLGKTVTELTNAEKKQAFMNIALTEGEKALKRQNIAITTYSEKMQQMRVLAKNVELFMGQTIVRGATALWGMLQGLASHFVKVYSYILLIFATLEAKANSVGLATSTYFAEAYTTVRNTGNALWQDASLAFDLAKKSAMEFAMIVGGLAGGGGAGEDKPGEGGGGITAIAKKAWIAMSDLKVKADRAWKDFGEDLVRGVQQNTTLVRLSTKDMAVSFGEMYNAILEANGGFSSAVLYGLDEVHNGIVDGIGSAWETMFGEANSLLEIFIKNFVEQLGSNVVQSAISGLLSLIPGGGFLAGIFGGLFHEGGTVPKAHGGAYINAPSSREFPILVRGGETIRTEAQEASLQRGRTTINVIVNGPVSSPQAFKEIIERGMRETGITDPARYFRSTRNTLVLES